MASFITKLGLAAALTTVGALTVHAQNSTTLETSYEKFMTLWNTTSTSADGGNENKIEVVPARTIKTDLDHCEIEIRQTAYMLKDGKIAAYDYSEISYDLGEAEIMSQLTLNQNGIAAIGLRKGIGGAIYTGGVSPLVCQRIFMPGWNGPDVERCPEPTFFSSDDALREEMVDAFSDLARTCALRKAVLLENTLSVVFHTDTVGMENASLSDLSGAVACMSDDDIQRKVIKNKLVPQAFLQELAELQHTSSRDDAFARLLDGGCDATLIPEYLAQEFLTQQGAGSGYQVLLVGE